MAGQGFLQEIGFGHLFPEFIIGTGVFRFQLHFVRQGPDALAQQILNAFRDMALVFQVVLNTKHAVAANGAMALLAGAISV